MNLQRIDHEIVTEDKRRLYVVDGKPVPLISVTQRLKFVAKPYLTAWQVKLGKEESEAVRDETSRHGRKVHELVQQILDGVPVGDEYWNLDEPVQNGLKAFVRLKKAHEIEHIKGEFFVYLEQEGLAGTFDELCRFDGVLTLADFKTGGLYPEQWLQLAFYATALQRLFKVRPKQIMRICLDRQTGIPTFDTNLVPSDGEPFTVKQAYDALLHIHKAAQFMESHGAKYW